MAELALVLPALLLIMLAMIDFGRVMYSYVAIINAAREGARYCATHHTDPVADTAGTLSRVQAELGGAVAIDTSTIVCPTVDVGQDVPIVVKTTFQPMTPFMSRFVGTSIVVATRAVMVAE